MRPTVLLVDAFPAERQNWRTLLENQKYRVYTTENAESAERLCVQLQPDLVLLFDDFPFVRGYELCRRLRQDPRNQLIPVVLISSSPIPGEFEQGLQTGAVDYWGMTNSLWDALSRVQSLLRLKSYIDEQAKSVLLALVQSFETKYPSRSGHSKGFAEWTVRLGKSCGLSEEDLQDLQIACALHDIGKVAVPDSILLKPGPLDKEETAIVRRHPIVGEKICAPLKSLRRILPVIRHHHERMDGSGYPDGLRGQEIPLQARILQTADIYDALVTDRPYRTALSSEEALETLRQEAARGWLDLSLVSKFSSICRSGDEYFPVRGQSMLVSYYT